EDAFKGTLIMSISFASGSRITNISDGAFQDCISLRSVIEFPNSLVSIGKNAFNNSAIRGISFDVANSKLASIGENGFRGCSSLKGSVTLPNNLTTIETYAFYGCGITDLMLGPNTRTLGTNAFANNTGLTELVIPNTVTALTISGNAFAGCMLTDIYLASSVNNIAAGAFSCTGVTASAVNLWFNGPMSNITIANGAFSFKNTTVVNVYADSSSEELALAMKTSGKVSAASSIAYEKRDLMNISFRVDSATPLYTSATAIYGSKVVLPYYGSGDVYKYAFYAVMVYTQTYISIFASEEDFENEKVAQSGDVISVYPLRDRDAVTMWGKNTTEVFLKEKKIITDSSGLDVTKAEQMSHYGGIVVIPDFRQSDVIHKNSVTILLDDGTRSYNLPLATVSIFAGACYSTIVLGYEDVMIDVTFKSNDVEQIVSVKLRSPFAVVGPGNPPSYDVTPMQEAPAGYVFDGWWDDETGGNRAIEGVTPFDFNEEWYAHFIPVDHVLSMTNTAGSPSYSESWTMTGPFQLHVQDKSLYYTDANHELFQLLFDANSVPGWSVDDYEDGTGVQIIDHSAIFTEDTAIYLRMSMNNYNFTLRFYTGGVELPSSETFYINDWAIGEGNEYHSGDVIENVSYSFIENGLLMPVPINQTHAFNNMVAGSTAIPSVDGRYTLTLEYFTPGSKDITISYNTDTGVYTVQFIMNDDAATTATVGPYTIGESFWLRAADYYTKTGYGFGYYTIPGGASQYADRQNVEITQGMAAAASYCVITVNAVWTPITYTVSFDLDPYEGTVPAQEVNLEPGSDIVTIPDVSANHGYLAASWYWIKGGEQSEPFSTDTELTADIIRQYATGQDLTVKVNWVKSVYRANVTGYPSYPELTDLRLGETFTLWTHTYVPDFKEFTGWRILETLYPEGEVVFDVNMATVGDSNLGTVSFILNLADIHYQVQYNPNGGSGTSPVDPNNYVIGDEFHIAEVDENVFYRYGYSFVGWKYSLDDDVIYDDDGTFKEELARNADPDTHAVTFYAVWAQKSYKINYELEGGRYGSSAPTNVRYGDAVTISNPTRVGYRFEGWTATGLTSGALYYSKSGMFMHWNGTVVDATVFRDLTDRSTDRVTASVTLTAHWAEASYSTDYNPNGGTWTSISSTQYQISIGDIIELPTVRGEKKTGYTFAGWGIDTVNTIPAGTRLTEAMITDPDKFTLYAIWAPVVYQIQYRYTPDYQYSTVNVDYGSTAFIPILDRAGYTFRGWSITGAGLEAEYSRDGQQWYKLGSSLIDGTYFRNMSSETGGIVTMDAEWNSIEYRLSYNTNGGTGVAPVDTNVYKVGDPVEMKDYKDLIGTNGSKIIIGWSLEINGSAVNVNEFTQGLCTMADATN
ncbi:MAG: leucine-rich repeat protein, partial [Candidatus Methanomethylophilaceae archaeon]|nr:leucine-rich repeat protein [Candidatus Methanomethylophilaceae archaeon]